MNATNDDTTNAGRMDAIEQAKLAPAPTTQDLHLFCLVLGTFLEAKVTIIEAFKLTGRAFEPAWSFISESFLSPFVTACCCKLSEGETQTEALSKTLLEIYGGKTDEYRKWQPILTIFEICEVTDATKIGLQLIEYGNLSPNIYRRWREKILERENFHQRIINWLCRFFCLPRKEPIQFKFIRHLRYHLACGLPLLRCLRLLADSPEFQEMSSQLKTICENIECGWKVINAFRNCFDRVLSDEILSILISSEANPTVDKVITHLLAD